MCPYEGGHVLFSVLLRRGRGPTPQSVTLWSILQEVQEYYPTEAGDAEILHEMQQNQR